MDSERKNAIIESPTHRIAKSLHGFTLVELLVVITIIGILIALLLPAVQAAREAARRLQCGNNFKQVALALHNYHAAKGCFPPGMFIEPPNYAFVFGWGIQILPSLEQQPLYDMISFLTPGGYYPGVDPGNPLYANRKVCETTIPAFLCPSDPQYGEGIYVSSYGSPPAPSPQCIMTNMCGVADSVDFTSGGYNPKDFPLVDGIFGANRPCSIADIRDGTTNTLLLGEVTGAGRGTYAGKFWAAWNIQDTADGINGYRTVPGGAYPPGPLGPLDAGFASYHPGGCNFAMADGSVSLISSNVSDAVLKALTTRDGMSVRSYTQPPTEVMVSGPP